AGAGHPRARPPRQSHDTRGPPARGGAETTPPGYERPAVRASPILRRSPPARYLLLGAGVSSAGAVSSAGLLFAAAALERASMPAVYTSSLSSLSDSFMRF